MQEPFPAVFLLGPPHSGKSVLAHGLSKALREREVLHYLLRATPDGEGDWFAEGPREVVERLRFKRSFSEVFVQHTSSWLHLRQMPLLVDPGGKPTPEQIQKLFAQATHAILLIPEGASADMWREILRRQRIPLLANLTSALSGPEEIWAMDPVLTGRIVGLERGQKVSGALFDALVTKVEKVFAPWSEALRAQYLAQAPVVPPLESGVLLQKIHPSAQKWHPEDLPLLAQMVSCNSDMAFYGRAPNWIVAFLAACAFPGDFWLFDARYGWVQAPVCALQDNETSNPYVMVSESKSFQEWTRVCIALSEGVIPYIETCSFTLPLPSSPGIILDGKIPMWLLGGLARFYVEQGKDVAVYQPNIHADVVVWSKNEKIKLGSMLPPIGRCAW